MTDQLEIGVVGPKKKPSLAAQMCVCGCFDERHMRGVGACTVHLACTKFRPRVKKPVAQPAHLLPPPGALLLERDDTKRAKHMGWALPNHCAIERELVPSHGLALLIYLAQLKTKSLNDTKALGFMSHEQRMRFFASRTAKIKSLRDRSCSAIAQAAMHFGIEVSDDHPPARVILTRVCSGKLDDDNLVGAFKPVRDGVADALGVDDKRFSIFTDGDVAITYRQEAPGKRKVCGVRIELTWETS